LTVAAMPQDAEISNGSPLVPKEFSNMSPCNKCAYCAIISFVVAAIMTPVGILVIAPKVAQNILDNTVISLSNTTLTPCNTPNSLVTNHAILDVPSMGLSSTLHPYTQSLYTTMCPGSIGGWNCGSNATKVLLGTYESPELSLSSGKNTRVFGVGMRLHPYNSTGSNQVISGFILPMFVSGPSFDGERVRLILESTDMSISVLGVKLNGLTMQKVLTCTKGGAFGTPAGGTNETDIANEVCHPDNLNFKPVDQNTGYTMVCVAGDSEPLIIPTTTPTTTLKPAPTPAPPTTKAPTTKAPTTKAPTTKAPTTVPTKAPTTAAPTAAPTSSAAKKNVVV